MCKAIVLKLTVTFLFLYVEKFLCDLKIKLRSRLSASDETYFILYLYVYLETIRNRKKKLHTVSAV